MFYKTPLMVIIYRDWLYLFDFEQAFDSILRKFIFDSFLLSTLDLILRVLSRKKKTWLRLLIFWYINNWITNKKNVDADEFIFNWKHLFEWLLIILPFSWYTTTSRLNYQFISFSISIYLDCFFQTLFRHVSETDGWCIFYNYT